MQFPLRPSMLTRAAALTAAATLATPALGDVLSVRGPAPDYSEISAAVLAAGEGDVIRIWPGTYQVFTIDDKALTLVRATFSGAIHVDGTYRIKNLAADKDVEITGVGAAGDDGYAVAMTDCQGSVRIREAEFEGSNSPDGFPWSGTEAVFIANCRDVELVHCTVVAGHPPGGEYGGPGSHALVANDSRVSLFASSFEGSTGTADDDPGAHGYGGGSGVYGWGTGKMFISGCSLTGGHGGDADYDQDIWGGGYGYGGNGGHGYGGSMAAWLVDNIYTPGAGGWSPDLTQFGSDGQAAATGTYLPGIARVFRASSLLDDQTRIGLRFEGAPGDRIFVYVGEATAYKFSPIRGPRLVAQTPFPVAPLWRFMGEIGGTGVLLTTLPKHPLSNLGHTTLHLQGAFVGTENYFGSSSWTTVLDAAW